jgi:hypothetical protein
MPARLFNQQAQLFNRVYHLMARNGLEAEQAHDPVADAVHDRDCRARDFGEDQERRGDKQRDFIGALQGKRFGRQFADNDVQKRDGGESDDRGERMAGRIHPLPRQQAQQRLEQIRDRRLTDPAERQTGEGDSELGGGDGAVEMRNGFFHGHRPGAIFLDHFFDLRSPHGDQRKLRRHKKAVQ